MSLNAGRMGTPPVKVHWYERSELPVILVASAILLVLLLTIWVALASTAVAPVPEALPAVNTMLDQRQGEWDVLQSALSPAQRAYQEQRIGEWTTNPVQPAVVPQAGADSQWHARMNAARLEGIR